MKKIVLLIAIIAFAMQLFAQDQRDTIGPWYNDGDISVNISQAYFNNWVAGGDDNFSGTALFNYYSNYHKNKNIWDNTLNIAYGLNKTSDFDMMKTDDKFDLFSDYGYEAVGDWYYSASFSFKTQFADGYDYSVDSSNIISGFLAPAYITLGVGMQYKPSDIFKVIISPLTTRTIVVNDQQLADAGQFGVDAAEYKEVITGTDTVMVKTKDGQQVQVGLGCKVRTVFSYDIWENVNLNTSLDLFSDYLHNPKNIDVDWQAVLSLKVNDYLTTTIAAQLVYDDDIVTPDYETINGVKSVTGMSPKVQFKEILSVGLMLRF